VIKEIIELNLEAANEMDEILIHEGTYLSNAGLVIVAAFLPAFFKILGLASNDILQNKSMAVCLIQYLATGNENMQDADLLLPKILCGMSVNASIDTSHFTTAYEIKNEVKEMLQSVIVHWGILQNTSTDSFQQSFLQRKGKLQFAENKWLLHMEPRPYDMLLQHLHWNFSMIQLPWMEKMLLTEWIY
jgi:hypothetical protein